MAWLKSWTAPACNKRVWVVGLYFVLDIYCFQNRKVKAQAAHMLNGTDMYIMAALVVSVFDSVSAIH